MPLLLEVPTKMLSIMRIRPPIELSPEVAEETASGVSANLLLTMSKPGPLRSAAGVRAGPWHARMALGRT